MPTLESLKNPNLEGNPSRRNAHPPHLYISPALYVTPEQAPIPESPSRGFMSPSPYVANQKRRRGRIETQSCHVLQTQDLEPAKDRDELDLEEAVGDNFGNQNSNGDVEEEEEEEGFFNPLSVGNEVEAEAEAETETEANELESRSFVSAQGDYFDANDEFSSDSSNSNIPTINSRVETELHAMKLSIVDEIERREAAEETLMVMRSQWERICILMSKAGFSFPEPPANGKMVIGKDSIHQFYQEILVTRFVAEAIGKGEARAEAEEAAALVMESKDQELLRLRDRLQYYETVNQELSQRKLVEVAQRQRQRKQQRRWVWGLAGFSIAIGISLVAYSCIPHKDTSVLTEFSDPIDDP